MDLVQRMAESLGISVEMLHRLEETMLEEMRSIQLREPDRLQEIVSEKQNLVERLEAQTAQQKAWMEQEGCSFTPDGIQALVDKIDEGAQLKGLWLELRQLIGRCDRLNDKNARLIERDRKRIALSLRILRGEDEAASTYGPQGRTATSRHPGRTISQA